MGRRTQEIFDLISYVRAYAPDFPTEDQTDTTTEFTRLLELLREVLERTKDEQRKWWLELSIREVEEALSAYESGDENKGVRSLDSAEEYLENYRKRKQLKPTFIAGPNGTKET